MLPKPFRITDKKEFGYIFKNSRAYHLPLMVFRVAKRRGNSDEMATRFAFVISKKAEKLAVKRNLCRRRLHAISFLLISSLKKGYDVVVILKPTARPDYSYEALKVELESGLKKLGIVSGS